MRAMRRHLEATAALLVRHDAHPRILWQLPIKRIESGGHLVLQPLDEHVDILRQVQGVIVRVSLGGEVGGDVTVWIAVAVGTDNPDLFAAQRFAERPGIVLMSRSTSPSVMSRLRSTHSAPSSVARTGSACRRSSLGGSTAARCR